MHLEDVQPPLREFNGITDLKSLEDEGLSRREYVKFYKVPVDILKYGYNKINAVNLSNSPTSWDKKVVYNMVELALYKNNTFLN